MSRRIVGYEGRRPIYDDPIPDELPSNPPGPIERRLATDEERAGFAPRIQGATLPVRSRTATAFGRFTPSDGDRAAAHLTAGERQLRSRERQIAHGHRPPLNSPEHLQQSRMRGAARHVEVVSSRRRVVRAEDLTPPQARLVEALVNADRAASGLPPVRLPVTPEEVVSDPIAAPPELEPEETLGSRIAVVADAAHAATETWQALQRASQASREADAELAAAEVAWDGARDALEASWRETGLSRGRSLLERVAQGEPAAELPSLAERRHEQLLHGDRDAPAVASESATDIPEIIPGDDSSTDDPQVDEDPGVAPHDVPQGVIADDGFDDAPEVVTTPAARMATFATDRVEAATGGGPGSMLARGQREVLEAVIRHDGDRRKAAEELHRTLGTVEMQLEHIGKKGLLPSALIARLPARFAKYSTVAEA